MTRHRKPNEWVDEIVAAATQLIDEEGYGQLTMDALAQRLELSKGGIYRFFQNRQAVALEVFRRLYLRFLNFDEEAALAWDLSLEETLFRLLFARMDEQETLRDHRVWIQLLGEVVWADDFAAARAELEGLALARYGALVRAIIARDQMPVPAAFATALKNALELGLSLMEGLMLQNPTAAPHAARGVLIRQFIRILIDSIFHSVTEEPHAS